MARLSHRPVRRGGRGRRSKRTQRGRYQSICTWHIAYAIRRYLTHTARTLLHPREMIDAGLYRASTHRLRLLNTAAIAQVRVLCHPQVLGQASLLPTVPHPRTATPLISRLSHRNPQISARTCKCKTLYQGHILEPRQGCIM
jgi:hypothetical protein